jgi:hypothetical protein
LNSVPVSAEGFKHLTGLKQLQTLLLFAAPTDPRVAELRRAAPGVEIYYGKGR